MLRPNLVKRNEEQHKLDIAYMGFVKSPDGKLMLEDLIRMFVPERLSTTDSHKTTVRAAQSDVITYIQRRVENGVKGISVK